MHILLAGNGKMAAEVLRVCSERHFRVTKFGGDYDHSHPENRDTVAIHFGSGSQLYDLVAMCEELRIPIIQGSTILSSPVPLQPKTTIISAPNTSLPMIRFLGAFNAFARAIRPGMTVNIVELHQSTKKDKSGTARAVAAQLSIPEADISSIRESGTQLAMGVPTEHLASHAYHDFIFTGQGVQIKVSTRIHGRATYTEGALTVAEALIKHKKTITPGIYSLEDILHILPK